MPCYSAVANGSIHPMRFVKLDATAAGTGMQVLECTAGDKPYGVSQQGVRNTPYSSLDDGLAAIAGENIGVFGPPEKTCMIELGGTVTPGDSLKAGTAGVAVTTTTTGDWVGAIALVPGNIGDFVPVQTVPPTQY